MTSFLAQHFSSKRRTTSDKVDHSTAAAAAATGNRRVSWPETDNTLCGSSDASATGGATVKSTGKSVPFYVIVDDDELACEPNREDFLPKTCKLRKDGWRKSVAGESYDPEADDSPDDDISTAQHAPKTPEQRKRLVEAVKDILLFRSLDDILMNRVIDAMFEFKVKPGDYVIRQGEDGDNFYVIETGEFDVFKRTDAADSGLGKKLLTYDNRGSFGELALMYNQPRAATVIAASNGVLWAMDRRSFKRIVLRSAYRKRQMYENVLSKVSFLSALNDYERTSVADALRSITYNDGDVIIREGDSPATGMYIIERGAVKVTVRILPSSAPTSPSSANGEMALSMPPLQTSTTAASGKTTEKVVAWLGVGDYFGELALLEDSPRTATVYAVASDSWFSEETGDGEKAAEELTGKVVVAFLERDSFERLLGPCRDIMKRNTRTYSRSASVSEANYELTIAETSDDVNHDDTFL